MRRLDTVESYLEFVLELKRAPSSSDLSVLSKMKAVQFG